MLAKKIGIDLGTANSLVWVEGEGIVLNEPTVVAVSIEDNRVVAVGTEAKKMLGRTPGNIQATRPMRDGVIADYVVTEAILRYFIQKVGGKALFFKPEVMICAPAGCTQVERRAVLDATMAAGARVAHLIDEPLAAAIGADIPIAAPSGNMIVDIGGGATEAAVISLGGVVVHKSARVAGNKLDEAIATYMRRKYNLLIGDQTAEEIKIQIGSALPMEEELTMEVRGRDVVAGLPRIVTVTSGEVTEAIAEPLATIITAIKGVLEKTPPELAADIIDRGAVMTGGGSLLRNMDRFLTQEIGVPCYLADEAIASVVLGCGRAFEEYEVLKRTMPEL